MSRATAGRATSGIGEATPTSRTSIEASAAAASVEIAARPARNVATIWAVTSLGHSHPAVVAAIREQASQLIHVGNLFYTEPGMRLAQRLAEGSLGGKVHFANSGTEANEAALKMLAEIGSVDRIPEYIKRSKDKNDSFRLMGFGHRVYKNYDPRAKIMQKTAHEVLAEVGHKDDPLLEVAIELERIALHDEYFIEKKLYPNIDFYSGITLKALGFPTAMFTVLFAVARTVGWISQWKEMIEDPQQKIGRPRQLYTGATQRDYVPISRRK